MELKGCTETKILSLCEDLKTQLDNCNKLPASPLTDAQETRKASNLMHKIVFGEENEDVLEAKWLHSAWTRHNA